ncbi:MAG: hypothetical protein WKF78_06335 [Candidatus Limnocylindrales bacterium]
MKAYEVVDPTRTARGLLARARTGERETFTELVERHHAELVRIAYAITGDLDAARDPAQLACIKAWHDSLEPAWRRRPVPRSPWAVERDRDIRHSYGHQSMARRDLLALGRHARDAYGRLVVRRSSGMP